jgi:hypothetical protein
MNYTVTKGTPSGEFTAFEKTVVVTSAHGWFHPVFPNNTLHIGSCVSADDWDAHALWTQGGNLLTNPTTSEDNLGVALIDVTFGGQPLDDVSGIGAQGLDQDIWNHGYDKIPQGDFVITPTKEGYIFDPPFVTLNTDNGHGAYVTFTATLEDAPPIKTKNPTPTDTATNIGLRPTLSWEQG